MMTSSYGAVRVSSHASAPYPSRPSRRRDLLGVTLFVLLTFGLSWTLVPLFDRGWWTGSSVPVRLLGVVLPYALMMGWQPLAAVFLVRAYVESDEVIDAGLRPAVPRYMALATLGALGLLGAASAVKWQATSNLVAGSGPLWSSPLATVSMKDAAASVAIIAVTMLLIWAQSMAEEVGFRGYLLPRSILLFGTWPGLILHAVLWGVWYAPLLLLSRSNLCGGVVAGVTFTITCVFLGALLGCLRLSSTSIAPSCAANSILTLCAGFPFLLHGIDVGLRTAAYEPSGWLPMLVALITIRVAGFPLSVAPRRFRRGPAPSLDVAPDPSRRAS
jgi:membrane protease YdiL (CAAX protease family)